MHVCEEVKDTGANGFGGLRCLRKFDWIGSTWAGMKMNNVQIHRG